MKKLLGILIAILMSMISPASMSQTGNELYGKHTRIVTQPKTATQNAQAHVKRIAKPKIFRSNPYRLSHFLNATNDDDIDIDDDSKITSYRRRDVGKIEDQEAPLSEYIRWRLFLARQLALLKLKEVHL